MRELEIKSSCTDKQICNLLIDKLRKETFGKYEHQLDGSQYGACYLKDIQVAQILWDKIFEYDGRFYTVEALAIMPNHVHLLLDTSIQVPQTSDINSIPKGYVEVSKWMQLIKGGSSFLINKYLGRSGTLWEKESYDHYVRYTNPGEFERIKSYILNNSKKAKLEEKFELAPYLFSSG